MEPKTEFLSQRIILGLRADFATQEEMDKNGVAIIMALWARFNERRGEIHTQMGPDSYGVIVSSGNQGGMGYLAGIETSDPKAVPAEMTTIPVPEGNYAVFTHRGPLSKIRETMAAIYGGWVPRNKAMMRNAPHLEIYGERFDADSEDSEFEVCVPVK